MKQIPLKLLTVTLAIAGIGSSQPNAEALTFSPDNSSPSDDVYSYSITLEPDEALEPLDTLVLSDLEGVTDATASSPFEVSTIGGGFSETDANFEVTNSVSGGQTLPSVIRVTSPAALNNVQYDLFTSSNSFSGTVNSATPVPFELSPGIGMIMAIGALSLRHLKTRLNK